MTEPNRHNVQNAKLPDEQEEGDKRNTTAEEGFHLVWQLTVEEWARKGIDITKRPMQKDVERLIRLKDK